MATTTSTSAQQQQSSSLTLPHIICRCCDRPVSTVNYPVMSKTCPHSICCTCLNNSNDIDIDNDNAGGFLKCPICQQDHAFHAHRSQPNYMAIAAMDIMEQSVRLAVQQQKQLSLLKQQQQQPNSNNNKYAASKKAPVISSPSDGTCSNDDDSNDYAASNDDEDEDEDESFSKRVITPPLPGQSRMVWIKFDSGSQLANLLTVKGNKAEIRWDGCKYKEWVDLKRIEEMMDATEKRACRRTKPSMKIFHDNNNYSSSNNKNKRRRKNQT
jgi:hypothetical protein